MNRKPVLWLLLAELNNPDVAATIPTLAWAAEAAGATLEAYLEAPRGGGLFAATGSTVLGGKHHEQFNYVCAAFEVQALLLGRPCVFTSSLAPFGIPVLAQSDTTAGLYRTLADQGLLRDASAAVFVPDSVTLDGQTLRIGPYLYPEIYFRRGLGFAQSPGSAEVAGLLSELNIGRRYALYLGTTGDAPESISANVQVVDSVCPGDDYGSLTLRVAERWKGQARGVAFGDPPAILAQVAAHCRQGRVAVYAPLRRMHPAQVKHSAYSEEISAIAPDVTRLANQIGNPVIWGRQTGDGDLFEWARGGVCMQIIDPQRPPFPVVETVEHRWAQSERNLYDLEPGDEQLRQYAAEGKVLAALLFHSGEVAHNEAMLSLMDLASYTGVKFGIGVHMQRYETCPQLWEMLNVPAERGGVQGLIEPVLYSGGRGIMAECNCPPELLAQHCTAALARIREIAGPGATPRGYEAFMDADLCNLAQPRPDLFAAIASSGLEYIVSCAAPGRNRVLWQTGGCLAINHSTRGVRQASNFIEVNTLEEYTDYSGHTRPGWMLGTVDSVRFFGPHLWEGGPQLWRIVDFLLKKPGIVNATPHTVTRYARMLSEGGYLPSADPKTVRHTSYVR